MQNYDVIIVGGGPTGVALGIELGLNNVKTLIIEKHHSPLLSPRAQSLNARSMEFFMRWKIDSVLKSRQLLPPDYPVQGIWCSGLNGKTYAVSSSNEQLNDDLSPQRGMRIPLWITEDVLRDRLSEFSCVDLLKSHEVIDVVLSSSDVTITAKDSQQQLTNYHAPYVVACDGANSMTRNKAGITFKKLSEPKRAISILFESKDIEEKITVAKGFLFYILGNALPGAIGPIDPIHGLWTAQVGYNGDATSIDQIDLDALLHELSGISFSKKIIKAHFWDMHIQIAEKFSKDNRIFLVGDSAHGFVPAGGFGLNTGLGDAVNLGWKLSAVIKKQMNPSILETYERERLPVCLHNLKTAQKNADDMMALRNTYDPKTNPEEFAKANAEISKQFAHSSGATLGYAYFDSPLIQLQQNQSTIPMPNNVFSPTPLPGYFLPHVRINNHDSIYNVLSATRWTLIVSGQHELGHIQDNKNLDILVLPENTYRYKYILIRPDWHIATSGDESKEFNVK